jgi:D-alanyl-D-alanine carboxypeptidase
VHARIGPAAAALLVLAGLAACGDDEAPAATTTAPVTSLPPTTTVPATAARPTPDARQASLAEGIAVSGAPGSVAVVLEGDERWAGATGTADLGAGTPADAAMPFRIASITKPFVATLVLDAVARGELSLDDDVATLVPGLLQQPQPVTVRQLLDHSSGLFDETNDGDALADIERIADPALRAEAVATRDALLAGQQVIASAEVIVALSETHERYFDPGVGWHYSNTNYFLAGLVLEAVTGQSLADLLRTRIAEPLGLRATTLAPPDLESPPLRGYDLTTDGSPPIDVTDDLVFMGNGAAGGIVSTADDTTRFFRALLAGEVLPPELLAEMEQPNVVSIAKGDAYGLGLATYQLSCGTFYGHEGGVLGTASFAVADATGERVAVMAQNARGAVAPYPALAEALLCG